MPLSLARLLAVSLVVVHLGLGVWAAMGFAELVAPDVPWPRLGNPLFSKAMLALQWTLILTAASIYVVGFVSRWRHTPLAMTLVYGAMALTCAYQTFFVLTHATRFRAMAIEYAEYALILLFL